MHETPIAKVFVFEDRVFKLKKAVDFGFLDFTTVEKRAWAIRRELEFNRRTAPDVYRRIHAIVRGHSEGLSLHDLSAGRPQPDGVIVGHVLEMRPFDSGATLANDPAQVDGGLAERLGRDIAGFQMGAEPALRAGGSAGLDYVLTSNADQLRTLAGSLGQDPVERLIADTRTGFNRLAPLLDRRRDLGFVRRCHGDLHLGNIVVEHGHPVLFDCIEFSDVLSQIDIAYDVAFLLMDLAHHGCGEAANRVLNAWLDQTGRAFGLDRLSGLAALPLFQSVRAAVRAHVASHGGEVERGRTYLGAAQRHLATSRPRLAAVGGLSASGKSTLARALAPRLGGPPGAVLLRSDEVRKRLFGAGPTERLPKSAYAPDVSARVYGAMMEEGRAALDAGMAVVLDAAFLKAREREQAEAMARNMGASFHGLWMQAPVAVLRDRIRRRTGDASDADEPVLEGQLGIEIGDLGWRRIDATLDVADQLTTTGLD